MMQLLSSVFFFSVEMGGRRESECGGNGDQVFWIMRDRGFERSLLGIFSRSSVWKIQVAGLEVVDSVG